MAYICVTYNRIPKLCYWLHCRNSVASHRRKSTLSRNSLKYHTQYYRWCMMSQNNLCYLFFWKCKLPLFSKIGHMCQFDDQIIRPLLHFWMMTTLNRRIGVKVYRLQNSFLLWKFMIISSGVNHKKCS